MGVALTLRGDHHPTPDPAERCVCPPLQADLSPGWWAVAEAPSVCRPWRLVFLSGSISFGPSKPCTVDTSPVLHFPFYGNSVHRYIWVPAACQALFQMLGCDSEQSQALPLWSWSSVEETDGRWVKIKPANGERGVGLFKAGVKRSLSEQVTERTQCATASAEAETWQTQCQPEWQTAGQARSHTAKRGRVSIRFSACCAQR